MKKIIESIKFGAYVSLMLFGMTMLGIVAFCLFIYLTVKGGLFLYSILIDTPAPFILPAVLGIISLIVGVIAAISNFIYGKK